jgi:hypothetical protein
LQRRLQLQLAAVSAGQQALIGQVTLRCADIDKSLAFYAGVLGMKLLSIQVK